MQIKIEGVEIEAVCECCGRKLKAGVRTDKLGTVGADCLLAKIAPSRFNPSRKNLLDRAITKEYHPGRSNPALLVFDLAA